MIAAIPTRYAGCHFRSRLEARWAVFLDELGIPWEYEPQGFELECGRYLPDFYLPRAEAWLEVKGAKLTKREERMLLSLAAEVAKNDQRCRLLVGDIPRSPGTFGNGGAYVPSLTPTAEYVVMTHPDHPEWGGGQMDERGTIHVRLRDLYGIPAEHWRLTPTMWAPIAGKSDELDAVAAALTAARSARFEHGQSGASP